MFVRTLLYMLPCALLVLASGCTSASPERSKKPSESAFQTMLTVSPLQQYLQSAPEPVQVPCSLRAKVSPTAVERFNELSQEVSVLYTHIYKSLQESSAQGKNTEEILRLRQEAELFMSTNAVPWDSAVQTVLAANYKATLEQINAQRKEISLFASTLRNDSSLTNIVSKQEQLTAITQISNDALKLNTQLKSASEGALLLSKLQSSALILNKSPVESSGTH